MAKISCFSTPEEVMMIPNRYDVYFMDMDSTNDATVLGKNRRLIDEGSQFVYMSINPNVAHIAAKVRSDYFITKPFDEVEVLKKIVLLLRFLLESVVLGLII